MPGLQRLAPEQVSKFTGDKAPRMLSLLTGAFLVKRWGTRHKFFSLPAALAGCICEWK